MKTSKTIVEVTWTITLESKESIQEKLNERTFVEMGSETLLGGGFFVSTKQYFESATIKIGILCWSSRMEIKTEEWRLATATEIFV